MLLIPHPTFKRCEYGYTLKEADRCPECDSPLLSDEHTKLRRCPEHGGFYNSVRGDFFTKPRFENSPHYSKLEALQHYQRVPLKGEILPYLADLVFDIDRADLRDAVRDTKALVDHLRTMTGQLVVFFSGKKGFHVIVPHQTLGVTPDTLVLPAYKRLARQISRESGITLDYSVYSRTRLLRRSGTRHPATGKYKIQVKESLLSEKVFPMILALAENPIPTEHHLTGQKSERLSVMYMEALEEEREFQRSLDQVSTEFQGTEDFHPCIQKLLSEGPPGSGLRNRTYLTLCNYMYSRDLSQSEAREILLPFTSSHESRHSKEFRRQQMSQNIEYVYRNKYPFRCHFAASLGVCSSSCSLYNPDAGKKQV